MNRRRFLKLAAAAGIVVAVPKIVSDTIELPPGNFKVIHTITWKDEWCSERHSFTANNGRVEGEYHFYVTDVQKVHFQDGVYDAWIEQAKIDAREKLWIMLKSA